jgi:hypothetical protein
MLRAELLTGNGASVGLPINAPRPVEFRNEFFQGRVVFMHREFSHEEYFASKRRFWELRWQGRFLRRAQAPVFIGAEIRDEQPAHGIFLRTTTLCALTFARGIAASRGARIACNYEEEISDRKFVLFPLSAADVKIESDSEISAPDIAEPRELVGKFEGEISERKIYTFAFYTMYTDLGNWCFANFPVISGTSLATFVGHQPIYAVMREGEDAEHAKYFLEIAFRHDLRSPAFESAISDPDDQIALLDLAAVAQPEGRSRARRGVRRKFLRCFADCWSGVKRLVSRSFFCV